MNKHVLEAEPWWTRFCLLADYGLTVAMAGSRCWMTSTEGYSGRTIDHRFVGVST
jgi:hypothetical protein